MVKAKAKPSKAPAKKKAVKHKTKARVVRSGASHKAVTGGGAAVKTTRHTSKRTLTLKGNGADQEVQFGRTEPYARWEKPRLIIDHYLRGFRYSTGTIDRATKVTSWPMYMNGPDPHNPPASPDGLGDCTCACMGHQIQAFTAYSGTEVTVTDADVLTAYEAVSGYDPKTGANDNGANVQDVLAYWRKTGVAGHKILAFAELTGLHNFDAIKTALDLFGTVYLGVAVPASAMQQFDDGEPWTVVKGSPIEGGHAIPLQKFNESGDNELEIVTWARLQPLTKQWWNTYVEEAWVVITQDWLDAAGDTVDGLDLAQLKADFTALTGESLTLAA